MSIAIAIAIAIAITDSPIHRFNRAARRDLASSLAAMGQLAVAAPADATCAEHREVAAATVCGRCGSFLCRECGKPDGLWCAACRAAQETTVHPLTVRWLAGWVAATALGTAVGLSWAGWLSRMALPRSTSQLQAPIMGLFVAVGFASIGAAQAWPLRRLIHNPWRWILATVVGLGLDGLFGRVTGIFGGQGLSAGRPLLMLAALLSLLVLPGLPQWWVLQRRDPRAWRWVPINAFALFLVVPTFVLMRMIPEAVVAALPQFLVRDALTLALCALPYALVQGLGLFALFRTRSG